MSTRKVVGMERKLAVDRLRTVLCRIHDNISQCPGDAST